jgi:hypothetical protein
MRNEWVRLPEILRWAVTAHLRTIFEQPSGGIGRLDRLPWGPEVRQKSVL